MMRCMPQTEYRYDILVFTGELQALAASTAQAITIGDTQAAASALASVKTLEDAQAAATAIASAYGLGAGPLLCFCLSSSPAECFLSFPKCLLAQTNS